MPEKPTRIFADLRCGDCQALDNDEHPPCCIALDNAPLVAQPDGTVGRDTQCLVEKIKESYSAGRV